MKTIEEIEERAKKYAWTMYPNPMFLQEWEECRRHYTSGATEQKAIDIERGKVFIKDLLLSIIGCEPKEGWIENILNEYEKTLEE